MLSCGKKSLVFKGDIGADLGLTGGECCVEINLQKELYVHNKIGFLSNKLSKEGTNL